MKAAATKVVGKQRQQNVAAWQTLPEDIVKRWHVASRELQAELGKPQQLRGPVPPLLSRLANTYPHVAYHVSQSQGFGPDAIKMAVEIAEVAAKTADHETAEQFFRRAFYAVRAMNRGIADAVTLATSMRGLGTALIGLVQSNKSLKRTDPARFKDLCCEALVLFRIQLRMQEGTHGKNDRMVQGSLHALATAAANVGDSALALECYTRNREMKAAQRLPTLAVDKQIDEMQLRETAALDAAGSDSGNRAKLAKARKALFELQYDELEARMTIFTETLRATVSSHRLERQTFLSNGWQSGPRRSKADERTGQHAEPENPVDAAVLFKTLVAGAKAAVQAKAFGDAEQSYRRALALAADPSNAEEITKSEQVVVLGSLGFMYCMQAQHEVPKGTVEYRATMAQAVAPYRQAIQLMEQLRKNGGKIAPETLESAIMQLGIVACNIERPDSGMHLLKRCRAMKARRNADTAAVDKHLAAVERAIAKKNQELLALSTQRVQKRAAGLVVADNPTVQQAQMLLAQAKQHLQAKNLKEAEIAALSAVQTFDAVADDNPHVVTMPEYRQSLTTAAAIYYSLGQKAQDSGSPARGNAGSPKHGMSSSSGLTSPTSGGGDGAASPKASAGFNQMSLALYTRALNVMKDTATSADDVAFGPTEFNLACVYVQLERFTMAVQHFTRSRQVKEKHGQEVKAIDQNLQVLGQKVEVSLDRASEALIRTALSTEDQLARQESSLSVLSSGNLTLEHSTLPQQPAFTRHQTGIADVASDGSSDDMEFTLATGAQPPRAEASMSFSISGSVTEARAHMRLQKQASVTAEQLFLERHRLVEEEVVAEVDEFHRMAAEEVEAMHRTGIEADAATIAVAETAAVLRAQVDEAASRSALDREMATADFHTNAANEYETIQRGLVHEAESWEWPGDAIAFLCLEAREEHARREVGYPALFEHLELVRGFHATECVWRPHAAHLWGNIGSVYVADRERLTRAELIRTGAAERAASVLPALEELEAGGRCDHAQGYYSWHRELVVGTAEPLARAQLSREEIISWIAEVDEPAYRQRIEAEADAFATQANGAMGSLALEAEEVGERRGVEAACADAATAFVVHNEAAHRTHFEGLALDGLTALLANLESASMQETEATRRIEAEDDQMGAVAALLWVLADGCLQSIVTAEREAVDALAMSELGSRECILRRALVTNEGLVAAVDITEPHGRAVLDSQEESERHAAFVVGSALGGMEAQERHARRADVEADEQEARFDLAADSIADQEWQASWDLVRSERCDAFANVFLPLCEAWERDTRAAAVSEAAAFLVGAAMAAFADVLYKSALPANDATRRAIIAAEAQERAGQERTFLERSFEDHERGARSRLMSDHTSDHADIVAEAQRDRLSCEERRARRAASEEAHRALSGLGANVLSVTIAAQFTSMAAATTVVAEAECRCAVDALESVGSHHLSSVASQLLLQQDESVTRSELAGQASMEHVVHMTAGALQLRSESSDVSLRHWLTSLTPGFSNLGVDTHRTLGGALLERAELQSHEMAGRFAVASAEVAGWDSFAQALSSSYAVACFETQEQTVRRSLHQEMVLSLALAHTNFVAETTEPDGRAAAEAEEAADRRALALSALDACGVTAHGVLSHQLLQCADVLAAEAHARISVESTAVFFVAQAANDEIDRFGVIAAETSARRQLVMRFARSRSNRLIEHVSSASDAGRHRAGHDERDARHSIAFHEHRSRETIVRIRLQQTLRDLHALSLRELRDRLSTISAEQRARSTLATASLENDELTTRHHLEAECFAELLLLQKAASSVFAGGDRTVALREGLEERETFFRILRVERVERSEREVLLEEARRGFLSARIGFDAAFPIGRARQVRAARARLSALKEEDAARLFGATYPSAAPVAVTSGNKPSTALPGLRKQHRGSVSAADTDLPRPRTAATADEDHQSSVAAPALHQRHTVVLPAVKPRFSSRVEIHESFQRDKIAEAQRGAIVELAGTAFWQTHHKFAKLQYAATRKALKAEFIAIAERMLDEGASNVISKT